MKVGIASPHTARIGTLGPAPFPPSVANPAQDYAYACEDFGPAESHHMTDTKVITFDFPILITSFHIQESPSSGMSSSGCNLGQPDFHD